MKNSIFKRFIITVICLAFTFGGAVACSKNDEDDAPIIVKENLEAVEVKIVFAAESTPADYQNVNIAINNKLAQDGKPYTVKFDFQSFTNYPTSVEDRAKDGYDAAWVHIDNVPDMINKKVIKPNIKPYLDEWGQTIYSEVPDYAFKQVTSLDDKIYAIPRHAPMANDRELLMVRGDWMKEIGMVDKDGKPKMTTLEEYDEYLSKIDSDKYSFAYDQNKVKYETFAANFGENTYLYREFAPDFYFPYYDNQRRPIYIDITQKPYKVKSFYNTENFQQMCEKANEYSAYLPKSATANVEDLFNSGMGGGYIEFSTLKMTERVDAFKLRNPGGELYDFFITENLEGEQVEKVVFRGTDNVLVALSRGKNTEELCDFISWTKNQENYDLCNYGVLNTNYFLTDNNRITLTKGGKTIPEKQQFLIKMPYWAFNDIDYMRFSEGLSDEYVENVKNWEGVWQDGEKKGQPNYKVSPLIGFNIQNTDDFIIAKAKVGEQDAMVDSLMQGREYYMDTVKGSDKTFYQKLLADIKTDGAIDKLIAEVQRQLDLFIAARGIS